MKELSKTKTNFYCNSNDSSNQVFPFEALGIEVPSSSSLSNNNIKFAYDMDTNRLAAETIEERNKKKARDLLEHMLGNTSTNAYIDIITNTVTKSKPCLIT